MRVLVYLPLLASLVLAFAGPRLARRMPPRSGTRLLLAAGLACAVTTQFSLALLTSMLIGRLPLVAAVGAWSADHIGDHDPVHPVVAKAATVLFVLLAGVFTVTAVRRLRSLHRIRRAGRLDGDPRRLVVIDDDLPEAFAVPGGRREPGRIVVSQGMLRLLGPRERTVLLAHEDSHLRHGHHRHRILASLAVAADPLLVTLPAAVHHLTERWADEDAASAIEDRGLTARTLARTALAAQQARRSQPAGAAALGYHRDDVPGRVRALLAGAPVRRPLAAAILAVFVLAPVFSVWRAGGDTADLFDDAGDACHCRPLPIGAAVDRQTDHLFIGLDKNDPARDGHRPGRSGSAIIPSDVPGARTISPSGRG